MMTQSELDQEISGAFCGIEQAHWDKQWFEPPDGNRYDFNIQYAYTSGGLVTAIKRNLNNKNDAIVWRVKPKIESDQNTGEQVIRCRFSVVPRHVAVWVSAVHRANQIFAAAHASGQASAE